VATSFFSRETSLRRAARKAFNGSTAIGDGVSKSHASAIPALEASGHHSGTSFGAHEDDKEALGDSG
jgi:hypothetical protein